MIYHVVEFTKDELNDRGEMEPVDFERYMKHCAETTGETRVRAVQYSLWNEHGFVAALTHTFFGPGDLPETRTDGQS